ncbi:ABC transporter permease [Balneolaceae bacterium YR4-1]|uniref:ABC transporter permease n=1 Tax=Halalkalibaculum roseum TaxID=2709311 RepID=A0A6M1SK79_9BACT|nr:FtsX-like permease family protein [Halalkalibaculum roseum]NGP75701.1 ABC transporter permease [Halalkalibaculum roseum]
MMIWRIISLGWKNIWRNPTRSAVVIIAVLLGIWAGVFISAFFNSITQSYLQNQLDLMIGHVQITNPEFQDQFNPRYEIDNAETLLGRLENEDYITGIQYESLATGLAQSAANSYGVTIHGIDTAGVSVHPITSHLVEGELLGNISRNPIVIGRALANRLELELRSKMVVSFQDVEGNITAGAFRIAGIFDSFNENYDKGNVYVLRKDLNRLLGEPQLIHKITLKIDDFSKASLRANTLQENHPDLKIAGWGEVAPELEYVFNSMDISLYIVMIIIIMALVFSIVNTMLMAVLERTKELGMLMAVGMNKARLFTMILCETFFLTMAGTPVGLFLSWLTVMAFGNYGIDLSAFSQGLNAYGLDTVIYPELSSTYYLNITLLIAGAALLSALYPAWKTLKLKPVEAIRKI